MFMVPKPQFLIDGETFPSRISSHLFLKAIPVHLHPSLHTLQLSVSGSKAAPEQHRVTAMLHRRPQGYIPFLSGSTIKTAGWTCKEIPGAAAANFSRFEDDKGLP